MNYRRVLHIQGLVLLILACAQFLPLACAVMLGDAAAGFAFGVGIASCALAGAGMRRAGSNEGELYRREGVLIVVGAWVLASLAGAVPYVASGAIASPVDAIFESASGFTTTGASVLSDVEASGRAVLLWRSFTQWLGGIGIVVLLVALLSELGPGARFLFKLEVPGPTAEILHARVRETATALARIYLALSLFECLLLLGLGLSPYDALTHTFATVSTGGFSPYPDSIARFSPAVQLVISLFMVSAGVNFSLYYSLVRRRDPRALWDVELRIYLALLLVATAVVTADLALARGEPSGRLLLEGWFQVVSIVTTTGFATADFDAWPDTGRDLLVVLMVAGGCAGSTAGGAKIIRILIGWRAAMREVRLSFAPRAVTAVTIGGRPVPEASVNGVTSFLVLWFAAWIVGTVLLAIGDRDLVTASTAAIATLANIGPGLEAVGPAQNYSFFAAWQKLVMVVLMWLGRLELFAVLTLLQRRFWRP